MPRYTHREIEDAKMLARNFSRNENVQVTPLSRFVSASRFFFAAIRTTLRMRAAVAWRYIRDRHVCPRCDGRKRKLTHVIHDEFEMRPCRLCEGIGEVHWKKVESFKWGQALKRYRLDQGLSLAQAFYVYEYHCLSPSMIEQYEGGVVRLDYWPPGLYHLADLQLDREAAGHVSTT